VGSDEEITRGGDAAQVLDSKIFVEAKQAVLEGIQRQMKAVPMSDQTMHSRLIMLLQCWSTLESYLDQVKQTGEIAQFQIKQDEERKSRFKMFG
jgi:D-serine deaminase-like pyridoxal phosphate-dependent protein